MSEDSKDAAGGMTRRDAFAATTLCFAMLSQKADASALAAAAPANGPKPRFAKDSEATGMIDYDAIHGGKGRGRIKPFGFGGAPAPANFIVYDLPPGASEGVHVHFLDNRNKEGAFDEYYYIVAGEGRMEIDGEMVPVSRGDHIHTPLEVAHGIENTHPSEPLRVFLTFIERGDAPSSMRGGG